MSRPASTACKRDLATWIHSVFNFFVAFVGYVLVLRVRETEAVSADAKALQSSKQLLLETRRPLGAKPVTPAKVDYEYEHAGTCNIFVAVEQWRITQVTALRTKVDFVGFACRMLRNGYSHARKVHLVMDNLNTHLRESFDEVLGMETAADLLRG